MTNSRYRVGYEWRNHRGQVYVFLPDNKMSRKDGFVARSRVVMAAKIGRDLLPEERVLHTDLSMENDDPDNLELFASQADLIHELSRRHREDKKEHEASELAAYLEKANRHREATRQGMIKAGRMKPGPQDKKK